eukprot:6388736-Amphidinium_carterae.2
MIPDDLTVDASEYDIDGAGFLMTAERCTSLALQSFERVAARSAQLLARRQSCCEQAKARRVQQFLPPRRMMLRLHDSNMKRTGEDAVVAP